MSNLIEIQSQIEKLQKQAQDIRSKEFASTVQDILAKMQAFGITVKDLQTSKPAKAGKGARGKAKVGADKPVKPAKAAKVPKKASVAVAAKFRGPNGETWSGRGLTPKWLAALVAQGRTKAEFAIAI
jgi:DNA-binding protein H-NS